MNSKTWETELTDGRTSRWQAHRLARRHELLHLAMKAIHRLGTSVSMDEIADSAGTSKSVFYRYFGDKSGLQLALADELANQMQERIALNGVTPSTAEEALKAMIYSYLEMAASSSNVYFFVTERIIGVAEAQGSFATLFTQLEQQFHEYFFKPKSRDAPEFSDTPLWNHWPKAAIGLIRAAGESWLSEPSSPSKSSLEEMTQHISDWLLLGLLNVSSKPNEVE